MKLNVRLFVRRMLPLVLFAVILAISGCCGDSYVEEKLEAAASLMESRPDSALAVLDAIENSSLKEKSCKAKHALLKSMALDKNYVDTTSFDVLQPAIDYYRENGTPDDRLRTYYYQGRIYQNRNERDSALHSFMKALDISGDCTDSLTIARTLMVQAILYKSFYDYDGYTENYLRAAKIYYDKHNKAYEFECLLNALNGSVILGRKETADSVMSRLREFESLDNAQIQRLENHRLTYIFNFGSEQDLKNLIMEESSGLCSDANGLMNVARAYSRCGNNTKAIQYLEYVDDLKAEYDTLKYLAIRYPILESLDKYEEALATYKDFSERWQVINADKFEQKSQSMEERHRMELETEREAADHRKTKWSLSIGIGILVLVVILMLMAINSYRIKKELAQEKTRTTEAENDRLKAENDLALEKARTTEAENEKLKSEKELTLERARSAELENRNLKTEKEKLVLANENLQLERDKKALEAENLAHRVKELEGESEDLKELLESHKEMPEEVRRAIQKRVEMLNSYLASQISDHKEFEKAYDKWVEELTANKEEFMDSNRLAFQASHPAFIRYFEQHGLTTAELNYICLYAIGLRGKDVGNYMKKRSHVNMSSDIRRKLGIDKHETNIGIYVRKKLLEF